MKVAVVLAPGAVFDVRTPNSIETVVRTFARHTRHEVLIVCDAGAEDRGELRTAPVDPSGGAWARTRRVIAALRRFQPDFLELHQHGPTSARIARAFPATASALYRHNAAPRPRSWLDRWRYERRFSAFDAHIFVSDALREDFAEQLPVFAARGVTVCNPIDVDGWRAPPERGRDPVLVFSGRATPEKGLDLVCEALPVVLAAEPGWRAELMLVDPDAHADWTREQLGKLASVSDRVRVREKLAQAEVRQTLARAAVVAMPSVFADPFPLAALEAHAAGAALVSSGRGGLRQISGDTALYVDPLDSRNLADAFLRLIRDPERRVALAAAGQAHVEREYGPERMAARLDGVREDLVRRRSDA
jgi:glycosyltransferase involved in cell wall biosynthesis